MRSAIQEELFGNENFTFLCSNCRGEFPRSIEFFPKGRCKDKMASFCRKCSNLIDQKQLSYKKNKEQSSNLSLSEKTCLECGETKILREFYMSSHSIDGKTQSCKVCIDGKHPSQMLQKSFKGFYWVVYFIQDSRNKRVKIGSSEDPDQTLFNLQEGSSEKLNLLAIHETGEKDLAEASVNTLHSLFKTHHTSNGWFEMVPSLEQYIALIRSGDNAGVKILLHPEDINKNKAF